MNLLGRGPAARPCRLRRCFTPAPSSSRLRPHGRAAPSRWCGAPQRHGQAHGHRVPGHAPALARASRVTAAHLQLAPDAWPGPLHHPGAQRRSSPRPRGARRAPSARSLGSERRPTRAPGARRTSLHLRKRRRWLCASPRSRDWAAPASLACTRCGCDGAHLVLALAARPSRSISESGDANPRKTARRSCRTRVARDSGPASALGRCRARRARIGRRSPRRSFPPGPPNLGTPFPLASLAEKESPGGKDALARRRSEWPRTATAGSPRGERRATTAPRSRPFPCQPLPPPRGPAACKCDGPGWRGASITSRPTARTHVTAAAALAGAAAARACAPRLDGDLGQHISAPDPRPSACSAARSAADGLRSPQRRQALGRYEKCLASERRSVASAPWRAPCRLRRETNVARTSRRLRPHGARHSIRESGPASRSAIGLQL